MASPLFKGIIAYPVTPFSEANGVIDMQALKESTERLITNGVHAIAPLGSTGESAYLSDAEWDAVADESLRVVRKRLPVVVGISDLTTANAVRRARFAERAGADAVMVLPISYWKLDEQEIFDHYAAIAGSISIPIMVYNNPATSGIDLTPQIIVRLVREIDNVTMVKESTGDIQRIHALYRASNGEIPFYNGSNPLALEALCAGAAGWCTAAPNLIPKLTLDLFAAVTNGALEDARKVFYKQLPVLEFILKGGLPTTVKAGLKIQGFDAGIPRAPLKPLSASDVKRLEVLLCETSQ
jgi:4-hydroxy-tetrahydrodipicolinate synthase